MNLDLLLLMIICYHKSSFIFTLTMMMLCGYLWGVGVNSHVGLLFTEQESMYFDTIEVIFSFFFLFFILLHSAL